MPFCNAKNHGWNCVCGFGGAEGARSAKRASLDAPDLFALPTVPRRYTKPNERCSFCDASVFFRRLANGGMVYFDEPGSPWPKHPCLDQNSKSYLGTANPKNGGWPLITDATAESVNPSVIGLSGRLSDQNWIAFVSIIPFKGAPVSARYLRESFIQAVPALDGRFNLALLTPDLRRILVKGYPTAAEATSEHK